MNLYSTASGLGDSQLPMEAKTSKPFWKSKTLIFNAVVAGLAALEAGANLVQPYVPGNVYAWALLALTVGNTVLRCMTTQGVALK